MILVREITFLYKSNIYKKLDHRDIATEIISPLDHAKKNEFLFAEIIFILKSKAYKKIADQIIQLNFTSLNL